MSTNSAEISKQVLMVAYLYAPIDNTGTRRTAKFVKYLPSFGYQPLLLTTKARGSLPEDRENFIFRADDLVGPIRRAYRSLKLKDVPAEAHANMGALPPDGPIQRWKSTYLPPDPEVVWYPGAVRLGRQIIHKQPIQLIYSTSSPETNHLVALRLKQKSGLPWVADFRDGWLFEPLRSARLTSRTRSAIEGRMEQAVLLNADRVITVNETIAHDLAQRYPKAASKISVITNGYDPDDFLHLLKRTTQPNEFRIVHTGALSLSRAGTSIDGFIQALQLLKAENHPIFTKLRIVFVGHLSPDEQAGIQQSGISDNFELLDQIVYHKALQQQVNADILLLAVNEQAKGISTSKLFEYLAVGRPILALSGASHAADIIEQTKSGTVVAPNNVQEIRAALVQFYEQWCRGELAIQQNSEHIQAFSRRTLTKNLAKLFDDLIDPSK